MKHHDTCHCIVCQRAMNVFKIKDFVFVVSMVRMEGVRWPKLAEQTVPVEQCAGLGPHRNTRKKERSGANKKTEIQRCDGLKSLP